MTPRQDRQQTRMLKVIVAREARQKKFIENLLRKKGVGVANNECNGPLSPGMRCVLKDFKRMAGGAVGVVWGCDQCHGGMNIISGLSSHQLESKLPPFEGQCRNNLDMGDANRLIIFPNYNLPVAPKLVQISSFMKGDLERKLFNVLA